jgi:aspartate kinase
MEQGIVSGVAHDTAEAKVTISGVPDRPGIAARIFRPLADAGVNIDMIVQNVSVAGKSDISFTVPTADLGRAEPILTAVAQEVGASSVTTDPDVAKISVVGAGMKTNPGIAADMFDALADAGINIEIISTSPIRISCVVKGSDVERAVSVVHDKFGLSEGTTPLK